MPKSSAKVVATGFQCEIGNVVGRSAQIDHWHFHQNMPAHDVGSRVNTQKLQVASWSVLLGHLHVQVQAKHFDATPWPKLRHRITHSVSPLHHHHTRFFPSVSLWCSLHCCSCSLASVFAHGALSWSGLGEALLLLAEHDVLAAQPV